MEVSVNHLTGKAKTVQKEPLTKVFCHLLSEETNMQGVCPMITFPSDRNKSIMLDSFARKKISPLPFSQKAHQI